MPNIAMLRTLFSIVLAVFVVALSPSAIGKPKQYDQIGVDGDVKIEVERGYKCQGPAPIRVSAPTGAWFEAEAVRFQRLIGVARIALSFDCPKIDAIEILGVAGSTQAYKGRVSKSGGWTITSANSPPVVELAKAPITKAPPKEKIQHPNRGELGGLWYGNARCGKGRNRKTKSAQLVFSGKKNGRYSGIAEIADLRGGTVKLPFSAAKGKLRNGRQLYTAKGKRVNNTVGGFDFVSGIARVDHMDGQPRHIAVKTVGRCKFISAARFVKLPGLSGEYAGWNSPGSLCTGVKEWLGGVNREIEVSNQWAKEVPDFVAGVKFDAGAKTSIFDDSVFKKLFGVSISEIDEQTYRKLIVQVGECATFREWPDKKLFRKNIDNYLTKYGGYQRLKGMVIPNRRSIRDSQASQLKISPTLTELKALHTQRRKTVGQIASAGTKFEQVASLSALNTLTQQTLTSLALLPPSSLTPVIESASLQRNRLSTKAEDVAQAPTEKLLTKRKTRFFQSDALAGHTLLASAFGHAMYVKNSIAQGQNCPQRVPVRVELGSLLPLKHYENRAYGKQFFFYAMNALDSMCDWPSSDKGARGWRIRAHYFFAGEPVGQLNLRRNDYSVYTSDADMLVNGWARNADHSDYAYDVAFSTMLGGLNDRSGQPIRALTQGDLEKLSQAGDLLATLHLSFDRSGGDVGRRSSSYSSGSAKADLSIDLGSLPRGVNPERLREASARGSVAASHLLALQLGLKSGMMRSPMTSKSISFEQLPKDQQNDFVLWAAKATHGRVYWSVFLNEAIDGWQIDLQPGMAAIAKGGFAAKKPLAPQNSDLLAASTPTEASYAEGATPEAAPVTPVAKADWAQEALSQYHNGACELAADLLTEQPIEAKGSWKAQPNACVFVTTDTGPSDSNTAQISVNVGQVTHRECSGDEAEQTCEIAYSVGCQLTGTSEELNQVCEGLKAFPLSIFATFERDSAKRWKVVGEVLKM